MGIPKLIVCGSIAIDRIMNFAGSYRDLIRPDKIHVLSLSVLLDKLEDTRGGTGANIAYSLALLGEKPVLMGSVGHDAKGYITQLKHLGIDCSAVRFSQLATASHNVITDQEDNQMAGFYSGAMADTKKLSLKPWANQNAVVCVSAHHPDGMRAQVSQCQKYNLRLFYDPGPQVVNAPAADLKAGTAIAEVLIVNDYELSMLCERTGQKQSQLKKRIPVVVTTLGRKGSIIEGRSVKRPLKIPAVKALKTVDPSGAGDGYRAGFLYGYLRKWDLRSCGQLGSALASFVVEHHGTQRHRLTKAKLASRYQQAFKERLQL